MTKKYWLVLILLVAFAVYWFGFRKTEEGGPKEKPLFAKRHSDVFNSRVDSLVDAYVALKNALVAEDTALAKTQCRQLVGRIAALDLTELKKDTTGIFETGTMQLNDVRSNAESLLQQQDLLEMRKDFNFIGESIYPLFKTIHYEGKLLYWQVDENAFGDHQRGSWMSESVAIQNPFRKDTSTSEIKDSIKAL